MSARGYAVITVGLLVTSVAQAAAPPRDLKPPSNPTIDRSSAAGDQRPTFQFGARDNRTAPLKIRFRCALDALGLHACPRTYRTTDALPFGKHTIRVIALDAAGNRSRTTTKQFSVIGTWDAALDFAAATQPQNPTPDGYGNSVWSYLYSPANTHDPTQYVPLPQFNNIDSSWRQWDMGLRADGTIITPMVGWNHGQMIFHPDRDGFAVLGWRSPFAGNVTITLGLRFPDPVLQAQSNGIVWALDRGDATLKSDVLMPTTEAHAEVTADVAVGDVFYLVIDNKGESNWDTTVGGLRILTSP